MDSQLFDDDRYDELLMDIGPRCLECRKRPPKSHQGVPQIIHHKLCLTGKWEKARRDRKIYIAPKPRPFQLRKKS